MPAQKQKTQLHYSRKKGYVEIDGDPADVKELARAERYERIFKWCISLLFIFLVLLLKADFSSPIWKTVEELIRHLPISAFIKSLLKLSG